MPLAVPLWGILWGDPPARRLTRRTQTEVGDT